MKRHTFIGLVVAAAAVCAGAGESAATPGALCVGGPGCFATVQAAVNAAPPGATIQIGAGTFSGGVVIDRNVSLVGVAASLTRISGGGPVLTIGTSSAAPTVRLANLTIT